MIRRSSGPGLALLLVWCLAATSPADKAKPTPSAKQLAGWIEQLDDDRFVVRDAAQRQLLAAGRPAIQALAAAGTSKSLEVTDRSIRILRTFLMNEDLATSNEAHAGLTRLATSSHVMAAARARAALQGYNQQIIGDLEKGGARIGTEEGTLLSVSLDGAAKLPPLLPLVRKLYDVRSLSLSNKQMDDRGLEQLKGLPQVKELNLFESNIGDPGLEHLKSFPNLRRVPMGHTRVTDAGLKHLQDLIHLEYVGVRGNQVTDAGLIHLRKLTNLTGLHLGETKVTDAGLVHLQGLTKITFLVLDNTAVGDAGLEHLTGMKALKSLQAIRSKITPAGVKRLRARIPTVEVTLVDTTPKP